MRLEPDFQPLYKQVYNVLVQRIVDGEWRPAEALPSEHALAAQLGVSQGTVRKALNSMVREHLLERRQGKGTYVSEQTQERSLFKFFRLSRPDGSRVNPTSTTESIKRRAPKPREQEKLDLEASDEVIEIRRVRLVDDKPAVYESVVLPVKFFPDLDQRGELPNALYSLFQSEYGVNIVTAEESLWADLATKTDAKRLSIAVGAPLLHIDRVALTIDQKKVEYRSSQCLTQNLAYAVTVK